MKKVLNILTWSLGIALLLVFTAFAEFHQREQELSDLKVTVDTKSGNSFVDRKEIEVALTSRGYIPGEVKSRSIDTRNLELFFDRYPSVKNADVYTTLSGELHVDIEQRKPILRIYSTNGDKYYIDEDGFLMPLSTNYSARVMVVNGVLNLPYNLYVGEPLGENYPSNNEGVLKLRELFTVAKSIESNPFWGAQFAQIYVDGRGELELIPRVGRHRIIIGNASDMDNKLGKLKVFYIEGLNRTGWNDYRTINLKFKDQVVCTKK